MGSSIHEENVFPILEISVECQVYREGVSILCTIRQV
ncbi:hypothetical protein BAE44_0014756 [Dichanthelium oligosanthes]|uniref:Uncharacterized protein n=1 Tax=Dichanthelium oligosanthes TaxID=888268 RepID=A0A1E5VGN3_9POAL|nr:hypothetical protein BAE44_0014756 [Dichanthelium oligosanthes]